MSKNFVIVIEADNRRALAAYQKGLADLDLIWPQLMDYAARMDEKRNERIVERRREREKILREYWAQFDAHEQAVREWERSASFFRGERPRFAAMRPYLPSAPTESVNAHRRSYESIRAELQKMANVAGAAIGPYRMTEHQVQTMIAWEDGSRVESIKADMERNMARMT